MKTIEHAPAGVDVEAAEVFVQRSQGTWSSTDQIELEARLGADPAFADAYARVEESWDTLDTHAETPEFMRYREEAMAYARRANGRRWLRPGPYTLSRWRMAAIAVGITFA